MSIKINISHKLFTRIFPIFLAFGLGVASYIVFAEEDVISPATVENLSVTESSSTTLTLTWTSPGDDNATGTATAYDIRYSLSEISEDTWAAATQTISSSTPQEAGSTEELILLDLIPSTTYYVALKTSDDASNESDISNVAVGTTLVLDDDIVAPEISNIIVSDISSTAVTISWTTNESSTSQVEYGTSTEYGTITNLSEVLVVQHSMILSDLNSSTTYHFVIHSTDESANPKTSEDQLFITITEPTPTPEPTPAPTATPTQEPTPTPTPTPETMAVRIKVKPKILHTDRGISQVKIKVEFPKVMCPCDKALSSIKINDIIEPSEINPSKHHLKLTVSKDELVALLDENDSRLEVFVTGLFGDISFKGTETIPVDKNYSFSKGICDTKHENDDEFDKNISKNNHTSKKALHKLHKLVKRFDD